jgi:hypothetical protein
MNRKAAAQGYVTTRERKKSNSLPSTRSRNRFLPRFVNKATTAKPIKNGEKNVLQNSSKINKRNTKNQTCHQR